MFGLYCDVNSATCRECRRDHAPSRLESPNQVIQDCVGDMFVEDSLIAIGTQVKFQRLLLQYSVSRDVFNSELGEIGLPGSWADAGELSCRQRDGVVSVWMVVRESLESACRLRFVAKQGQSIQVGIFGDVFHRLLPAVNLPLMSAYHE